jgi:hypothetical protein
MYGVADALTVGVELTTTLTLSVAEHPLTLAGNINHLRCLYIRNLWILQTK